MTIAAPGRATRRARLLAAALVLLPATAPAQGLLATQHELEFRRYTETGANVVSARNSLQYAITPRYSVQLDFLRGRLSDGVRGDQRGLIDGRLNDRVPGMLGDFQSFVSHGVWQPGGPMTFGAYLGRDYALGDDATTYGVETRFELYGSDFQIWAGRSAIDGGPNDVTTIGMTGHSDMAAGFGLDVSVIRDEVSGRGASFTNAEVGASYDLPRGAEAFASVGYSLTDSGFGTDGEATLGLGLRIGLGGTEGVTFGSRSFFESLR